MIQEKSYNTYCIHPQCLAERNAFFSYSMSDPHVKGRHPIREIHPLKFAEILESSSCNGESHITQDRGGLLSAIDGYIQDFCERMTKFMKENYLASFYSLAKNEIEGFKLSDPSEIANRLKQGDYAILAEVLKLQNKDLSKYPFQGYFQQKAAEVSRTVKGQIDELYLALEKIIKVAVTNKDDFLRIARGQLEELSPAVRLQVKKSLGLGSTNGQEPMFDLSRNRSARSNDYMDSYFSFQSDQESARRNQLKTKAIKKPQQKTKTDNKDFSKAALRKKKSLETNGHHYKAEDDVIELGLNEVMVINCRKPDLTLDYIKNKYPSIHGLHIFTHKLATKVSLPKILCEFKSIRILTLNCEHEFEYTMLSDVPRENLQALQNLELCWDFNRFMKEYQILKYFPSKKPSKLMRITKVYLPAYLQSALKSNESMLVHSEKKIEILKSSKFSFEGIKTFHYSKLFEQPKQQHLCLKQLSSLVNQNLRNLVTLNLEGVQFPDSESYFRKLIMSNRGIKTIRIASCQISKDKISNVFQVLKVLPDLRRLTFEPSTNQQDKFDLLPEWITCLYNLQQLYLNNLAFDGKEVGDSSSLKGFNNLKKLTHLSLYGCNPVYQDFFSYLDLSTLSNLQFLNIGITQVNQKLLKYFPSMRKLQYLNLDQLDISGDDFTSACKEFYFRNKCLPPLKYLSIQQINVKKMVGREWSYNVDQMRQIGRLLPNLTYLQINGCNNLKDYNFADFKALRTLAINKFLGQTLKNLSSRIEKYISE